jgi:hypothetical protein
VRVGRGEKRKREGKRRGREKGRGKRGKKEEV